MTLTKEARWLRVEFGDNDFGNPVTFALERLWEFADGNSSSCAQSAQYLFNLMFENDMLKPTIERAIDAEYLYSAVEYMTRIHPYDDDKPDYEYAKSLIDADFRAISEYLSIEISLHDSKDFAKKWCNGEEAYLDLETGDCATY